ncbi:protein kinase domain-containing protein [Burkholderia ubonensis]|uniref:protein kinase domain-containing protein n=1 Tax=Burkholderia ubonensis TaxID=101571 RepID=UPI0009B49FF5|nr:serine/threonine-protein kinase [Burkholderia ubonensis]
MPIELRIDKDFATLTSLEHFARESSGTSNTSILGKKDSSGKVTLYVDSDRGVNLQKIFRNSVEEKANAKAQIASAFLHQFAADKKGLTTENVAELAHFFTNLNEQHLRRDQRPLESLQLLVLIKSYKAKVQRLKEESIAASSDPFKSCLPDGFKKKITECVHLDVGRTTEEVSRDIVNNIFARNPSDADKIRFLASNGENLKAEIKNALSDSSASGKRIRFVQNSVHGNVVSAMFPNRELNPAKIIRLSSKDAERFGQASVEAKDIVLDGKIYHAKDVLGVGSFGCVLSYESGNGDRFAYKICRNPQDVALEAIAHLKAQGDGHPNVLKLKSVVATKDDKIGGVILEIAPHGDTLNASFGVGELCREHEVPREVATVAILTLFKDMLSGMKHIHDGQGQTHGDFKPENTLLGEDGLAKVADFGTTVEGTSVSARGGLQKLNIVYQDPRVHDAVDADKRAQEEVERLRVSSRQHVVKNGLKAAFRRDTNAIKTLLLPIMEQLKQRESDKIAQTRNDVSTVKDADTWSIGIALARMIGFLSGERTELDNFNDDENKIRNYLFSFAKNPANVAIGHGDESGLNAMASMQNAIMKSSGDEELDKYLNRMLHPNPGQRATLGELLIDPILDRPGVGTPQARDLLIKAAEMVSAWGEGETEMEKVEAAKRSAEILNGVMLELPPPPPPPSVTAHVI